MHDQLSQRAVETVVSKRQPLGNSALDADVRKPVPDRRGERGGRITRRDSAAAHASHQLPGQRSRPAAHIQHPLTCPHTGYRRELHSQRLGKTAHEPGIGIRADLKHHNIRVVRAGLCAPISSR